MHDTQSTLFPTLFTAGVEQHRGGRHAQALGPYSRALALDPANGDVLHLLGLVEGRAGDLPRGLAHLARSRRLNPDQPEIANNIAAMAQVALDRTATVQETPDWDCAVLTGLIAVDAPAERVEAVRTRVAGRWLEAATALYNAGRLEEAYRLLIPLVRAIPDDGGILNILAIVQRRRGYAEESLAILRHAHTIDRGSVPILINLASVCLQLGDVGAALGCYHELAGIALNEYNAFRLDNAEAISRQILGIFSGIRNAHIVLGLTLIRLGQPDEAAAALAEASRVDPEYAPSLSYRGDALLNADRVDEAETAYRRANALNPLSAEAIGGIGIIRYRAGQIGEARRLLERSQRLKSHISATSATLTSLRLLETAPPATRFSRRAPSGRPALSISSLNRFGRLAHTIHDYITVRLYAEKYGLELETPEWGGGLFFDLDDPPMTAPRRNVMRYLGPFRNRFRAGLLGEAADPIQDVDVFLGWTLVDFPEIAAHRETVQGWMKPRPLWMPRLRPALDRLEAAGETIVAIHIRRTDRSVEGAVNFAAYRSWLARLWDTLPRPVLLVATDDASVLPEFAPFAPRTLQTLAEPWRGLEHLQDFYLLMNADVVALSFGGFARVAAALGTRARMVVEPDPATGDMRPVNLWGL